MCRTCHGFAIASVLLLAVSGLVADARAAGSVPEFVSRANWSEVRTRHLVLLTDGETSMAWDVARRLERFRRALEAFHPTLRAPGEVPMTIVVLNSQAEVDAYAWPGSENMAAYFLPNPERHFLVLNGQPEGLSRKEVVFHEFSHAFLEANLPAIPLWLHEGLAQYLATCRLATGRAEFGYPDPNPIADLTGESLLSLEMMFHVTPNSGAYLKESQFRRRFYAEAYLLTHYLRSPKQGQARKFDEYLARLQRGAVPRDAFSELFPRDSWDAIVRELPGHIRQMDFESTQRVPLADSDLDDDIRERRVPLAEALCRLGELALALDPSGSGSARPHFEAALALEPGSAIATAGIGVVADLATDVDQAERRYADAIALAPTDARVWNIAARGAEFRAMRRGRAGSAEFSAAEQIMRLARDRYARSLELDPANLQAMGGFGKTQSFLNEPVDSLAVRRLSKALELQPGRYDLAVALAVLHSRAGNREAARAVVESRFAPAEGQRRASELTSALDAVERMQADTLAAGTRTYADTAMGAKFETESVEPVQSIAARVRLEEVRRLAGARKLAEAEKLLTDPAFVWPTDEHKAIRDIALTNVRGQLQLQRALALVKAGKLAEARAVFEAVAEMDVVPDMKAYARKRAADLAGYR